MISDAKSGGFQYIAVYMFDCFKRNRRESILCKEMLKENVIKVISILGPIAEDEGGEFYGMFLEFQKRVHMISQHSKAMSTLIVSMQDIRCQVAFGFRNPSTYLSFLGIWLESDFRVSR